MKLKLFQTKIFNLLLLVILFAIHLSSCKKQDIVIIKDDYVTKGSSGKALQNNLVAWYTFNGNTLDSSGYGNNVLLSYATPTKGKNGISNNAYNFNGTSNFMVVKNSPSLNPTEGITLVAVIKPTGFYPGLCHGNKIIMKGYSDYAQGGYMMGFDDQPYYNYNGCYEPVQEEFQNFYGSYGDGQPSAGVVDTQSYIQINKWYTVVYTYDGQFAKIYVNGALKNVEEKYTTFSPTSSNLFFGRMRDSGYPYYFNGAIDEIRIYNTALSSQQIAHLLN